MVGDLTRRPVAAGRLVELLLGHAFECFQDDSIAVAVLADQPRPFVRVHLSSHGAAHGAADRNRTRNLLFTKFNRPLHRVSLRPLAYSNGAAATSACPHNARTGRGSTASATWAKEVSRCPKKRLLDPTRSRRGTSPHRLPLAPLRRQSPQSRRPRHGRPLLHSSRKSRYRKCA